ncbi:fatty-acid--AMP ligase [Mycobacterium sp. SMC-4]|uniref:fatty-acid--AMP ligase n=1 Tax=Mycobacterium sp. SMC-4 TaxID=2857059 RepID=UPI0021B3A7D6|nr:fatty-acid--AMP ligase [Mycobacterium sp. SMC-4]UXA15915.1 fatty-acid--AMP ligase [Mycobacterium sp. SMC-4]
MATAEYSIPALVAQRSTDDPDGIAYTFVDYDVDPAGVAESLTWSELNERIQAVAQKLSQCGEPGDRAVILAPQNLDYVVAFLGAIEAGFIAVPLSAPLFGHHDERIVGALADSTPVAILTTSPIVDDIRHYAQDQPNQRAPKVIEVDLLEPFFGDPIDVASRPKTAYLQYTSGSTRAPAGVEVTHKNVIRNIAQLHPDYFAGHPAGEYPPGLRAVSWLPLYHDMGLVIGIFLGLVSGAPTTLMSPIGFMLKPARWMQQLAVDEGWVVTAAPNFAYELAARRTKDEDLEGRHLRNLRVMINGAERVHGATLRRFHERFDAYGLPATAIRSSYGLAEATIYVSSTLAERPAESVFFDLEKLSAGHAERSADGGSEQVSCGPPRSTTVRIVDPETCVEKPAGQVGEVWLHGDHVTAGYWRNPEQTARVFRGKIVEPTAGTPAEPWLRTGDLGMMFEDELYIVGRIKDLLIVDGRNHYPDDIEATVREVTGGRVAAISLPEDATERLVVVAELKKPEEYDQAALEAMQQRVTAAVSEGHSVRVSDLVLVGRGSLPLTTSGKVRRAACLERYRLGEFSRLGADR